MSKRCSITTPASSEVTVDNATRNWLQELFTAIDAKDTGKFLEFLTIDASFRFGSAPPAEGNEAIRAAVEGFFSTIAASNHALGKVMRNSDVLVCEGEVTYTRHDKSTITLPFANIFEFDGALISNYKIYADAGPLYAQ